MDICKTEQPPGLRVGSSRVPCSCHVFPFRFPAASTSGPGPSDRNQEPLSSYIPLLYRSLMRKKQSWLLSWRIPVWWIWHAIVPLPRLFTARWHRPASQAKRLRFCASFSTTQPSVEHFTVREIKKEGEGAEECRSVNCLFNLAG